LSEQQQTTAENAPMAYTVHQVAMMLGCSPRTIQRSELIPGRLTINKKGKRQTVRFLRTAVDQWLSDARK
jgi:excisionase family DNA binding protein